jgi:hypothetical protein
MRYSSDSPPYASWIQDPGLPLLTHQI